MQQRQPANPRSQPITLTERHAHSARGARS